MPAVPFWHAVYNDYARTVIRVKARQLVRRPGFSPTDLGDIEQKLAAHLIVQARNFDAGRASLNTFIARVVDSAVAMLLRGRGQLKRAPSDGVEIHSLEVMVEETGEPPTPLWATISLADLDRRTGGLSQPDTAIFENAEAFAAAMESMSPEHRDICCRILGGSRAGLSRRKVRAAMVVIRQHFERAGFGQE